MSLRTILALSAQGAASKASGAVGVCTEVAAALDTDSESDTGSGSDTEPEEAAPASPLFPKPKKVRISFCFKARRGQANIGVHVRQRRQ